MTQTRLFHFFTVAFLVFGLNRIFLFAFELTLGFEEKLLVENSLTQLANKKHLKLNEYFDTFEENVSKDNRYRKKIVTWKSKVDGKQENSEMNVRLLPCESFCCLICLESIGAEDLLYLAHIEQLSELHQSHAIHFGCWLNYCKNECSICVQQSRHTGVVLADLCEFAAVNTQSALYHKFKGFWLDVMPLVLFWMACKIKQGFREPSVETFRTILWQNIHTIEGNGLHAFINDLLSRSMPYFPELLWDSWMGSVFFGNCSGATIDAVFDVLCQSKSDFKAFQHLFVLVMQEKDLSFEFKAGFVQKFERFMFEETTLFVDYCYFLMKTFASQRNILLVKKSFSRRILHPKDVYFWRSWSVFTRLIALQLPAIDVLEFKRFFYTNVKVALCEMPSNSPASAAIRSKHFKAFISKDFVHVFRSSFPFYESFGAKNKRSILHKITQFVMAVGLEEKERVEICKIALQSCNDNEIAKIIAPLFTEVTQADCKDLLMFFVSIVKKSSSADWHSLFHENYARLLYKSCRHIKLRAKFLMKIAKSSCSVKSKLHLKIMQLYGEDPHSIHVAAYFLRKNKRELLNSVCLSLRAPAQNAACNFLFFTEWGTFQHTPSRFDLKLKIVDPMAATILICQNALIVNDAATFAHFASKITPQNIFWAYAWQINGYVSRSDKIKRIFFNSLLSSGFVHAEAILTALLYKMKSFAEKCDTWKLFLNSNEIAAYENSLVELLREFRLIFTPGQLKQLHLAAESSESAGRLQQALASKQPPANKA